MIKFEDVMELEPIKSKPPTIIVDGKIIFGHHGNYAVYRGAYVEKFDITNENSIINLMLNESQLILLQIRQAFGSLAPVQVLYKGSILLTGRVEGLRMHLFDEKKIVRIKYSERELLLTIYLE